MKFFLNGKRAQDRLPTPFWSIGKMAFSGAAFGGSCCNASKAAVASRP